MIDVVPPVVSVSDLTVRLGSRAILDGIRFGIPPGSLLAVLGPNGSGKSTLLRTLVGLVTPHAGTFMVGGRTPERIPPGLVGYVPQIKSLDRAFPARAVELVVSALRGRWPGRISPDDRERAMTALSRVGAGGLADRPVGGLSGGELQRVYLARSIMRDPAVLLLDEPEAGVDMAGTADLHQVIDQLRTRHGTAIMLVTHDWEAAIHHATHVLLLCNRQVSFGPPEEAFSGDLIRTAFGHVGHAHSMLTGAHG